MGLLFQQGIIEYQKVLGGTGSIKARRNRITGKVQMRYHNETFNYWCWSDIRKEKYCAFKPIKWSGCDFPKELKRPSFTGVG